MEFPYAEMHAFPDGDAPHSGNPAGVVMLHRDLPDADLLGVAQSNNLSETAYLKPMGEKDQWGLRWFTPGLEVELCGHATLASAAWLFETGRVVGAEARFHTLSGLLKVSRLDDGRYQMDFLDAFLSTRSTAEWMTRLGGIAPVAPVNSMSCALTSPEARSRIETVSHPDKPEGLKLVRDPVRINGQDAPSCRAPKLGEDTREILDEMLGDASEDRAAE